MIGIEPEKLAGRLVDLRRRISVLELEFSRLAADFAATDAWDAWGFVSAIDWIRQNCLMGAGTAGDRLRIGQAIAALPDSEEAVYKGEIGFQHLCVLVRTADRLKSSRTAKLFVEESLLEPAKEMSVGKFANFCHHAVHAADPDGALADHVMSVEERRLKLSTWEDGSLLISGRLDSVGGAAVRTALEPLARKQGKDDYRDREQRLADALVEFASRGTTPAHVQVTTSLETMRGLAGASAAEMEFSLPICWRTVQRFACDCSLTRVLLAGDSMVIDVGRSTRVVSGPTKRALRVRDKHCQWPGCERPASWTEAHHLIHWVHGGPTELSNLVCLCNRHHFLVHEGRWQLVRTEDGSLRAIPPLTSFSYWARGPDTQAA
jgi:hypothetical protein